MKLIPYRLRPGLTVLSVLLGSFSLLSFFISIIIRLICNKHGWSLFWVSVEVTFILVVLLAGRVLRKDKKRIEKHKC
jgi:hypothetical protein